MYKRISSRVVRHVNSWAWIPEFLRQYSQAGAWECVYLHITTLRMLGKTPLSFTYILGLKVWENARAKSILSWNTITFEAQFFRNWVRVSYDISLYLAEIICSTSVLDVMESQAWMCFSLGICIWLSHKIFFPLFTLKHERFWERKKNHCIFNF